MSRGGRRLALVWLLIAASATAALAGPPTDQLKARVDRVLEVLRNPPPGDRERQRQLIHEIASEAFDWNDVARRALGQYWPRVPDAERQEYVRLFTELVERSYFPHIESYSGEKIDYVGDTIDGDYATVRTVIHTKAGNDVPVDYRMQLEADDRWMVYDVMVEGVSLVGNYRSQFHSVISTSSFDALLTRLRARLANPDAEEPPPPPRRR